MASLAKRKALILAAFEAAKLGEKLGVPSLAPSSPLGTPAPPDADGPKSSDYPPPVRKP